MFFDQTYIEYKFDINTKKRNKYCRKATIFCVHLCNKSFDCEIISFVYLPLNIIITPSCYRRQNVITLICYFVIVMQKVLIN